MSTYKGKTVTINTPAEKVAERFADLSAFAGAFDQIDASQKAQMGDVRLEPQAIIITNPAAGELRFDVVERTPQRITLQCSSPLPLAMNILMEDANGGGTLVSTAIEVDLPIFIRPLIGPQLQKAADGFSDMVARIAEADGFGA